MMEPKAHCEYLRITIKELESATEQRKRETAALVRGAQNARSREIFTSLSLEAKLTTTKERVALLEQRLNALPRDHQSSLESFVSLLKKVAVHNNSALARRTPPEEQTKQTNAHTPTPQSQPTHTTPTKKRAPKAGPGTPKLEDFGISASTLALVADKEKPVTPLRHPILPSPISQTTLQDHTPAKSYAQIAATPPKPKEPPSTVPASTQHTRSALPPTHADNVPKTASPHTVQPRTAPQKELVPKASQELQHRPEPTKQAPCVPTGVTVMSAVAQTEKEKVQPASLWNNFDLAEINVIILKLNNHAITLYSQGHGADSFTEKDIVQSCGIDGAEYLISFFLAEPNLSNLK